MDKSTKENSSVVVFEQNVPMTISCEEHSAKYTTPTGSNKIIGRLLKRFENVSIRVKPKKCKKKLNNKIVEGFWKQFLFKIFKDVMHASKFYAGTLDNYILIQIPWTFLHRYVGTHKNIPWKSWLLRVLLMKVSLENK